MALISAGSFLVALPGVDHALLHSLGLERAERSEVRQIWCLTWPMCPSMGANMNSVQPT